MENIVQKLGWQKLRLISAAIFLFVIVMYFSLQTLKPTTHTPAPVAQNSNVLPTSALLPTPQPQTAKDYKSVNFVDSGYKISYPSFWTPQVLPVVGGGTLTHFSVGTSGGENFPRVDIQATPISSSSAPISQLLANLAPLKLQQGTTIFHNQTATTLSGELPFTFKSGNPPVDKRVSKTFVFFDYNNTRYIIDYAYYLDGNEDASMQIISKTLASYQF